MPKPEQTPVLFRYDDGEVVAVFPTNPADDAGHLVTCYAHIGQHSGCSRRWYQQTRPARADEYAGLLKELIGIGYQLKIYKRWRRASHG